MLSSGFTSSGEKLRLSEYHATFIIQNCFSAASPLSWLAAKLFCLKGEARPSHPHAAEGTAAQLPSRFDLIHRNFLTFSNA
jgi:hypothetical protein